MSRAGSRRGKEGGTSKGTTAGALYIGVFNSRGVREEGLVGSETWT